ncbi:MAG: hypothetical protein HUK02_05105 [Bacteroidaceae bacterium]|nr:hypothetical protein [Bacteroidaceae bacterium]
MSDGNFNRSLLPSTPYRSGVKTGKALANAHAQQVFASLLQEEFPNLDAATLNRLSDEFKRRIHTL